FGLSTGSLMAFSFQAEFGTRYPVIGPVDRLFGMALSDPIREIGNELYSYQYGAVNVATTAAALRSTDPRRVLSDLKSLLLSDGVEPQQRNITIYNVSACGPMVSA